LGKPSELIRTCFHPFGIASLHRFWMNVDMPIVPPLVIRRSSFPAGAAIYGICSAVLYEMSYSSWFPLVYAALGPLIKEVLYITNIIRAAKEKVHVMCSLYDSMN